MVESYILDAMNEFYSTYKHQVSALGCKLDVEPGKSSSREDSIDTLVIRILSKNPFTDEIRKRIKETIKGTYDYKGIIIPVHLIYTRNK